MEKSWENFWTTGKVDDYLKYRNKASAGNVCRAQKDTMLCDTLHESRIQEKDLQKRWKDTMF